MRERVVITGIGMCTPLGRGHVVFWSNLLAGRSGIGPITLFDASSLPVRIGGEFRELDRKLLTRKFPCVEGEKDRKVWLGLEAASQAIEDAGLNQGVLQNGLLSVGVSLEAFVLDPVGLVVQAEDPVAALARSALEQNLTGPLQTPLDRLTEILAETFGLTRGCYTNCSACAAGAQSIGEAYHSLRKGDAPLALAGATDSAIHPLGLGGFSLLHILSEENDQPARACRPFDASRQGTVLSEGSVFIVLESLEHAVARRARIYAEICGYGSSLDAYRVTDPEPTGRGAALSMVMALADADVTPEQVDGINAHGTGTPKNDVAETLAIKQVFGAHAYKVPVTANKSMTGHMIATSGAAEAAASVLSLFEGKFPPTINLEKPDPECDLDYVPGVARDFNGKVILSNSFGFGGQNATLIFNRPLECNI